MAIWINLVATKTMLLLSIAGCVSLHPLAPPQCPPAYAFPSLKFAFQEEMLEVFTQG